MVSVEKLREDAYNEGFDDGFASADDWLAQHEDAMAEHGWVRLPVDADGVPIHLGDVVRYEDPSEKGCPFEVKEIYYQQGRETKISDGEQYGSIVAERVRHYREPTVEELLCEYALACEDAGNAGHEVRRLAKEYAAKLMLAGDE